MQISLDKNKQFFYSTQIQQESETEYGNLSKKAKKIGQNVFDSVSSPVPPPSPRSRHTSKSSMHKIPAHLIAEPTSWESSSDSSKSSKSEFEQFDKFFKFETAELRAAQVRLDRKNAVLIPEEWHDKRWQTAENIPDAYSTELEMKENLKLLNKQKPESNKSLLAKAKNIQNSSSKNTEEEKSFEADAAGSKEILCSEQVKLQAEEASKSLVKSRKRKIED